VGSLVVCNLMPMDPANILFWNVCGFNVAGWLACVRNLIVSSRIDVVCLQQTKMEAISQVSVLQMLGPEFSNFIFHPSVGASGGILIAWRDYLDLMGNSRVDNHSTSVQFYLTEGPTWWLTCVYGPQGNDAKVQFLQELRQIRLGYTGLWLVAGDFNHIYREEDKNNLNLDRVMIGRFRRWISDLSLKQIPLHGRRFNWSNEYVTSHLRDG
jgi:exonuclease III